MASETTLTFTNSGDGVRVKITASPPIDNGHLFGIIENGLFGSTILHDRSQFMAMVVLDLLCEEIAESRVNMPITIEYNGEEARPRPHDEGLEKHVDALAVPIPIT